MKKLVTFTLMTLLLLGLAACAGTTAKSGARVKCPACGYEFEPNR